MKLWVFNNTCLAIDVTSEHRLKVEKATLNGLYGLSEHLPGHRSPLSLLDDKLVEDARKCGEDFQLLEALLELINRNDGNSHHLARVIDAEIPRVCHFVK